MINLFKNKIQNDSGSTDLQHGQFISRIFTDQIGQQFRLTFFVTIIAGEPKGHLVSVQPISSTSSLRLSGNCEPIKGFCLPIACPNKKTETVYVPIFTPIVSPFTELFFFTSQPTRAPSCR